MHTQPIINQQSPLKLMQASIGLIKCYKVIVAKEFKMKERDVQL